MPRDIRPLTLRADRKPTIGLAEAKQYLLEQTKNVLQQLRPIAESGIVDEQERATFLDEIDLLVDLIQRRDQSQREYYKRYLKKIGLIKPKEKSPRDPKRNQRMIRESINKMLENSGIFYVPSGDRYFIYRHAGTGQVYLGYATSLTDLRIRLHQIFKERKKYEHSIA